MIIGCRHQTVGDEEQVKFAALGNADTGFSYRPTTVAVECPVHAPASNMIAGAEPEYGEMHLALSVRHGASPRAGEPRWNAPPLAPPSRATRCQRDLHRAPRG